MTPFGPYRPASWRGIEFGIWNQESSFGRATALHGYPFRDPVWVEDLGRGTRRLGLVGFRVGDDVGELEREMIDAAEEEGPGQLVHPTLGLLKASLIEFRSHVRHDLDRVVELHFVFVESSDGPLKGLDAGGQIGLLAEALNAASTGDFVSRVGGLLRSGAAAVQQVQRTVGDWTGLANRLAGDIRTVLNVVALVVPGIDRRFGRFVARFRRQVAPVNRVLGTVGRGVDALGGAQRGVLGAAGRLQALAGRI